MISLVRKFTWWWQRRRKEDELREELQFHLEEGADERQVTLGPVRVRVRRDSSGRRRAGICDSAVRPGQV